MARKPPSPPPSPTPESPFPLTNAYDRLSTKGWRSLVIAVGHQVVLQCRAEEATRLTPDEILELWHQSPDGVVAITDVDVSDDDRPVLRQQITYTGTSPTEFSKVVEFILSPHDVTSHI